MPIQQYNQYNDPLTIVYRKGTPDDPFKNRMDSLPVINNQITLLEIPSQFDKVQISGFTEINQDIYQTKKELGVYEIFVNYSNGNIQFHPSWEGKTLLCKYKGRGIIMYPASRIYALVQRSPDIVKTLQDIIDEANQRLESAEIAVKNLSQVINHAIDATNNANVATDNANIARDEAIQATEDAELARQKALDASASTIMIYKEPVQTYEEMLTTYPEPENGWRVMIKETGDIYRYDGVDTTAWELIDNFVGGSIPLASETTSGLLGKEDYKDFTLRSIAFVMPSILFVGVQNYIIQFPFDGEVVNVYGYCTKYGTTTPFEATIEKVSEAGFGGVGIWENISTNLVIDNGVYKSNQPSITQSQVAKGDYFRVNVTQLDNSIKGVTIQLDIKI